MPTKYKSMKNILTYILIFSFIASCNTKPQGNMVVKGNIKGLKKGTIYLQKLKDTLLVSVDSVELNGQGEFILSDQIESPEIYYVGLNEIPDEKIIFFGEEGEFIVNSKLEKFATSAEVKGLENQVLLEEYQEMVKKFNGKNLDLIKEIFDARKEGDSSTVKEKELEQEGLNRRKYLYTTNFALLHSETEIAPFLALTELYNANIKLLDTINNSLSIDVANSKYGVQLNSYIEKIKVNE